jgi:hypothetical protein
MEIGIERSDGPKAVDRYHGPLDEPIDSTGRRYILVTPFRMREATLFPVPPVARLP